MKYLPVLFVAAVIVSSFKIQDTRHSSITHHAYSSILKKRTPYKKVRKKKGKNISAQKNGSTLSFPPCPFKNDFTFGLDVCNPATISFSANTTGYDSIHWEFGDGNTADYTSIPVNTYATEGNYVISMITFYPDCSDTVTRTISVNTVQDNNLITTRDTTICDGSVKQIHSTPGSRFCWSPSDYLDDPSSPDPVTSTPQTITYYLHTIDTGANLIVNGNFSNGNTGFTSQYIYSPSSGFNAGVYTVGANIQAWHSGFAPCTDHTTGTGNVMMINGADIPDVALWSEVVPVTPNTNYEFAAWVETLVDHDPAILQFSINGNVLGEPIFAPSANCEWERFFINWNSGNATSATISIVNQNTELAGNDFALDDISFAPVYIHRDSVKITVGEATTLTAQQNTSVCKGDTVQLHATGGVTYLWSPASGLSDPASADPLASPLTTTTYTVKETTASCATSDSVLITVNPLPVTTAGKSNDIDCRYSSSTLSASGGGTYSWSPGSSLDDPASPRPVAIPVNTTTYFVQVTDINGCTSKDSVTLSVKTGGDGTYYIPNAFTPNSDGLNDCFGIKNWGNITDLEFSIYNRWGQRIFFTTNPAVCWDGTVGGIKQNPGAFVYMIRAKSPCRGEIFRKGTVLVIR